MEQKYFKYFQFLMKWAFGLKSRIKKKDLYIFDFDGVKVALLNDIVNKRVVVFYFKEATKDIHRVVYYGYHAPELRKRIVYLVKDILREDTFFEDILKKRRVFSYAVTRNRRRYLEYKNGILNK